MVVTDARVTETNSSGVGVPLFTTANFDKPWCVSGIRGAQRQRASFGGNVIRLLDRASNWNDAKFIEEFSFDCLIRNVSSFDIIPA